MKRLAIGTIAVFALAPAAAHANAPEALSLPNSSGGYMRDKPESGWQIGTFPVIEENERRFKWAIFDNGVVRFVYYKDEAPVSLTVGPDGNVWLADVGGGSSIDRFDPTTDEMAQHKVLPWPTEIIVGPDGALWFTSDWPTIGRITTSGEVTEYALPPMTGPEKLRVSADGVEFYETWAKVWATMSVTGAYALVPSVVAVPARSARPARHRGHRHACRRHRRRPCHHVKHRHR